MILKGSGLVKNREQAVNIVGVVDPSSQNNRPEAVQ